MKNTIWLIISLVVVAVLLRLNWQPEGGTTEEIPAPQATSSAMPSPSASPASAATPGTTETPDTGESPIPLSDFQIEGIGVGMTRSEVEAKLGKHDREVFVTQSGNDITFYTKDGQVLFSLGNHPLSEMKSHNPQRSGVYYEHRAVSVGYESGKVAWVYGPELTRVGVAFGNELERLPGSTSYDQYLLDGIPTVARQGYCMDGPWAFLALNGRLEVCQGYGMEEGQGPARINGLFAVSQRP